MATCATPPTLDVPEAGDLEPEASARLLTLLRATGYRFVTPTPATHRRVLKHDGKARAADLRDVLGWSLPFSPDVLPERVFETLQAAGALSRDAHGYRAKIRVSSLGEDLFIHSAFPPASADSIFFGPDTYRFARLLKTVLAESDGVGHLVDIGTGSAAGAVVAAKACRPRKLTVSDVNRKALAVARINLAAAGLEAEVLLGAGLDALNEEADLIIANPPFIAGDGDRTYRDGGDMLGARLSLDWALQGAAWLRRGGRFILYTGSAIVNGRDALHAALVDRLDPHRFVLSYDELDPDIFGSQLSCAAYREVERIAAIGAVIRRL